MFRNQVSTQQTTVKAVPTESTSSDNILHLSASFPPSDYWELGACQEIEQGACQETEQGACQTRGTCPAPHVSHATSRQRALSHTSRQRALPHTSRQRALPHTSRQRALLHTSRQRALPHTFCPPSLGSRWPAGLRNKHSFGCRLVADWLQTGLTTSFITFHNASSGLTAGSSRVIIQSRCILTQQSYQQWRRARVRSPLRTIHFHL